MARKLIAALAATAAVAFTASAANATVFTGTWSVQVLNNVDPGLVVAGVPDADAFNVNLGAAPQSFDMFDIFTNEGSIEWDDLTNPKTVALTFNFTAPGENNGPINIGGQTVGYSIFGVVQGGKLTWNNGGVGTFNWGVGNPNYSAPGKMTISVNGGTFNEGWFGTDRDCNKHNICNPGAEGLTVAATFDWDNDPVGVPEPATWALMISGFGMAGATLRRRRALTA